MIEIGNIKGTPKEYILGVYDAKTLQPKASIVMPDDTVIHAELMADHYLQFSFNCDKKIDFNRTDYIKHNGIKYMLRRRYQPQEINLQHYKYTLKFEAPEILFQDIIAFYLFQNYKEVEWTLTGTPEQFMKIAVAAINDYFGNDIYSVGIIEPTDVLNIHFDGTNVFDCLTTIAETFNAEWYLNYETNTINLVAHHEIGDIVTLQREVSLIDIQQSNENDAEYCTRLYAFGSTRNIPTNYRTAENGEVVDAIVQKKLRLPIEVGDYIDAFPDMDTLDIIPKVKVFDHIYPKRIGTITSLRSVDKTDDDGKPFIIYYFKDEGLNFKKEYIIPGLTLMLSFGENSWLNGRDFELGYNDDTEEFEIINDQSLEITIPNDILKPRLGDLFTLYNFDISLVGDQYVGEAEKELEEEARKWLEHVSADNATYTCPVNPVYRYENDLDLPIGQRVRLKSLMLDGGEKVSRVFGYDKYPITDEDSYIVGDKPKYSRLAKIDKTAADNKKITDLQYLEAMKIAKFAYKNVKAMNYLRTALENETSIEGGLILTSLIRLGMMVGDTWQEKAGVGGIAENGDDIAFWAGGTLEQAINLVADPNATEDVANYVVTHGGKAILNEAFIRGKFESSSGGKRIILDPDGPRLLFKDNRGRDIGSIDFVEWQNGLEKALMPQVKLLSYNHIGEISRSTVIDGHGITIESDFVGSKFKIRLAEHNFVFYKGNEEVFAHGMSVDAGGNFTYHFTHHLPKSKQGLESGEWWNNNGIPNITP